MTKIQKKIIDRIEKAGGVIVVCPYGIYTRSGQYVAFCSGSRYHSTTARDAFLKKFCSPFTKSENEKVARQHTRRLAHYQRLAIKCINEMKFESAAKLVESAGDLMAALDKKNGNYALYYKLKGKLTVGK